MYWNGHPTGLMLAKKAHSGPDFISTRYAVDPADLNRFFIGSPVRLTGEAFNNGVPIVTLATPGDAMVGAVVGWDYIPTREGVDYIEGGAYLHVCDDPDAVFVATADNTIPVSSIGLNFNLTAQTALNGRLSDVKLDSATGTPAATGQMRLLRKVQANWADLQMPSGTTVTHWEVKINRHQLRNGVAGL